MMKPSALHSIPSWRNVVAAELRSVGVAIRQPAVVALLIMVGLMLVLRLNALRQGNGLSVHPEMALLVALFAPLLPIAVWKGEYRFRHSYLASMPVDRTRHVLVKIAAGWAWLMVLTLAFMLWMLLVAVVTGGEVGEVYLRVLARDVPAGATPAEAAAHARHWTTPHWQWIVFFTGTTVSYLSGSAIVLASSRTRRWLAGFTVVCIFVSIADDEVIQLTGIAESVEATLVMILEGRYGLETLILGRAGPIADLTTTAGEKVSVWRETPVKVWLLTTLLWTGLAVASVAAVVWGDRKA